MEDRVKTLERDVTDLRISNAELSQSIIQLKDSVKELNGTVGSLRDTMNRGRGALWVIGSGAGVIGALASYTAGKLFGA